MNTLVCNDFVLEMFGNDGGEGTRFEEGEVESEPEHQSC
jgi:hypothetical protein